MIYIIKDERDMYFAGFSARGGKMVSTWAERINDEVKCHVYFDKQKAFDQMDQIQILDIVRGLHICEG